MGVLTLYTTFKEKGIFLVAVKKDRAGVDPDQVWNVSSLMKRFDDKYQLDMTYSNSTKNFREAKLEKSVASWFDDNGVLVFDQFELEVSKLHNSLLSEKKDK
ncbi:Signal peptidase complex subunit 2 [Chamberlinius hualienensis]